MNTDRERFLFAHGMLRSILGQYLGCLPHHIVFKRNAYGKPTLVLQNGVEDIRFNMAHSRDVVLIALCRFHDVGVDIEYMRAMSDLHEIISRNFASEERHYLSTLPADKLKREFFAHWTIKESFIKGIGLGLSYPLENFRIELEKARGETVNFFFIIPKNDPHWQGLLLEPYSGYIGAVAAKSIIGQPILWNFH